MRIVISLGGSLIVPNKIDYDFLERFEKVILKLKKHHEFIIVTGGGDIARDYIDALHKKSSMSRSLVGIASTKLNALLVANFLGFHHYVPDTANEVKRLLNKNGIVVCGALGYRPNMTSDGTSTDLVRKLRADYFINMTDVKGLYSKDPKKHKDAKFISKIGFDDFLKKANKIKYKSGQHFVLDQFAARMIKKYKIKTIILKDIKDLENCIGNKEFIGTVIY
ncbi:UMP kinase [Candidatus Woesearchaeota archaeon]|nr:UMP kinase [Candidatus Woesearchaeota archaeon]